MMAGIYPYFTQKSCRILERRIVGFCQPCCISKHNQLFLPPMKFFAFIMSFFLLYLSCLPCSDSKECNIKAEQTVSASTDHQKHKHTSEACTPFCTCSCCAASAFHQPFAKQQALKQIFQSVKYHIQNDSFLSQEFSSIWQPPKIS